MYFYKSDMHPHWLPVFFLTGHDCSIRLWNMESKTCIQEFTAHRKKFEESIHDVAFHPTKCYIGSAGADALAKVFVWPDPDLQLTVGLERHEREMLWWKRVCFGFVLDNWRRNHQVLSWWQWPWLLIKDLSNIFPHPSTHWTRAGLGPETNKPLDEMMNESERGKGKKERKKEKQEPSVHFTKAGIYFLFLQQVNTQTLLINPEIILSTCCFEIFVMIMCLFFFRA